MKNLIKLVSVIILLICGNFSAQIVNSNAQDLLNQIQNSETAKKRICYTVSCCSIIEIWSQTTCYYVYKVNTANKVATADTRADTKFVVLDIREAKGNLVTDRIVL